MSHSGSSRAGVDAQGLARCPHAFEPTGFGYLLGPPMPQQRSQLGENPAEAHRLLAALAQALPASGQYWQTSLQDGVAADDNPFIPSGYTYLLQLVAHDAVQTSVPFWAAAQLGLGSRNLRSSPLLLDTLYGGGPNAATVAYRTSGDSTGDRTQLRVGRFPSMTTGEAAGPEECPFRDLARINLWPPEMVQTANFDDPFVTCVADARNDDNLVLMQLVALFANLHNAIASRLTDARPEAVFGYAQVAMQRIYHAVVEQDLLPRLLHPDVLAVLRGRSAGDERWLWRTDAVPREFTHGAFRIGHAMVRKEYSFNARPDGIGTLPISLAMSGGTNWAETRVPLRQTWLVDWSRFFELSPGTLPRNLSRRFSPSQSALDEAGLFKSNDREQPETLSLRDMLSAVLARPWSVDAMLDTILARSCSSFPSTWVLRDTGKRHAEIRDWLSAYCGGLAKADIDTVAEDPPLPLFVLLESALDAQVAGRHLGPLGSIIIGEVIGRSVARQRQALKTTEDAAQAAFGADFWSEITAVTSMPALIAFADRHGACSTAPLAPL